MRSPKLRYVVQIIFNILATVQEFVQKLSTYIQLPESWQKNWTERNIFYTFITQYFEKKNNFHFVEKWKFRFMTHGHGQCQNIDFFSLIYDFIGGKDCKINEWRDEFKWRLTKSIYIEVCSFFLLINLSTFSTITLQSVGFFL